MIYYLVAMEREAKLFKKFANIIPSGMIDVIGINAVNLDKSKYSEEDILVNVGYAGGYKIPVGALVEPSLVYDAESMESIRIDQLFHLEHKMCITSSKFVEEPLYDMPSMYDMELFKIASECKWKKLYSIKIISDNLDEKDCEGFNSNTAWKAVAELIKMYLKS